MLTGINEYLAKSYITLGSSLNFRIFSIKGVSSYQWPNEVDSGGGEDRIIDRDLSFLPLQIVNKFSCLFQYHTLKIFLSEAEVFQLFHAEVFLSCLEISIGHNQTKVFPLHWSGPKSGIIPRIKLYNTNHIIKVCLPQSPWKFFPRKQSLSECPIIDNHSLGRPNRNSSHRTEGGNVVTLMKF